MARPGIARRRLAATFFAGFFFKEYPDEFYHRARQETVPCGSESVPAVRAGVHLRPHTIRVPVLLVS